MGLFGKKRLTPLPQMQKLPELTFSLAGHDYWLGMSVKSSDLQFEKDRQAHKKLGKFQDTAYPVAWMRDKYGNRLRVGFVNRGIEAVEYQDAEIAFILLNLEEDIKRDRVSFFNGIDGFSDLEDIRYAFRDSQFAGEEVKDVCMIYNNYVSDVSFAVNDDGVVEVQYNLYK